MEDMKNVPVHSLGGFFVQYTDAAREQASRLGGELRNKMHNHLNMISAVNPQLHGEPEPGYETQDRRFTEFENLTVTFWLSVSAKVLTVVDIQDQNDPFARIHSSSSSSNGFIGFNDEESKAPVTKG